MIRVSSHVRYDLDQQLEAAGFTFSRIDGCPYWDESARYQFTLAEIEQGIEEPTNELYALCLELVDRAASNEALLTRLRIPPTLHELIGVSWRQREPSLYGRFDFSLAPDGTAKLLEFNADTPTSLYESAVFQWSWLEQGIANGMLSADDDQFNSIHDALLARWPQVAAGARVHFASLGSAEDEGTTAYVRETARLAGVDVGSQMTMETIGLKHRLMGDLFVDAAEAPIACLFKLYPWEWLTRDTFGRSSAMRRTRFVEPAWKAILSTKAVLPLLWEMAPSHPNLLPARFEDEASDVDVGPSWVRKRCYSREGANIDVFRDGRLAERTAGPYDDGACIIQGFAPLPDCDGHRPLIGSWIVGERACGIGVREGKGLITTDAASFVPHVIRG